VREAHSRRSQSTRGDAAEEGEGQREACTRAEALLALVRFAVRLAAVALKIPAVRGRS
jgi:hypothetical protein